MKKLFNLENLIHITILALPLYLLRFSLVGIPSNVFEVFALVCVIWFLIQSRSFRIALRDYETCWMPICLVVIGLLASTLLNDEYRIGFGVIKGWFVIPLLFAWVAVETLRAKEILRALYAGSFIVAVLSLIYFLSGALTYDGRLEAIYNSPNYLAMYLAPAIIIGVFLWAENKKLYTFSLGVIILAFYLTYSYAAWAAIFLAILAGLFFGKNILLKNKILWLILAVVMAFVLFQVGTDKMANVLRGEERSSLSSRVMIWSAAGKMIQDNPVWGIGPGNFQNKYLEYQKYFPPYLEWAVPQPHNIFLAFWLQAGFLGLAGFVWLLFLWFKNLRMENKKEVQMIGGLIMIYIILHGLFDTTYFKNDLAVIFWLVFLAGIKKPALQSRTGTEN